MLYHDFYTMFKGAIALDIDGTITAADHTLPRPVHDYLSGLVDAGWLVAFVTGRTFSYGYEVVQTINFPFMYGCYNGAYMLQMPERKIVVRHLIDGRALEVLERLVRGLCVHTGIDEGDHCYLRPEAFDKEMVDYLLNVRRKQTSEPWVQVEKFELESFCYAKTFGLEGELLALEKAIARELDLATVTISDPLHPGYGVMLITHGAATKAGAVRDLRKLIPEGAPVIAAGDDYNDLSMIIEADVGIAMATAPKKVLEAADIIAPPSTEQGIIQGLSEALP